MNFEIAPEEVKAALDRGDKMTLLEVRELWEHELAPIAGAIFTPMSEVPSRAHPELDPQEPLLVFCHDGVRSIRVVKWLAPRRIRQSLIVNWRY